MPWAAKARLTLRPSNAVRRRLGRPLARAARAKERLRMRATLRLTVTDAAGEVHQLTRPVTLR